jgi:glycosyltransferase involved in cell wall biosynthesis
MTILFVGNFLLKKQTYQAPASLAQQLQTRGWEILRTSQIVWKPGRLLDMLKTTWSRRRDYDAAYLAVFSGQAFLWAEAVGAVLRKANKPFVVCLHGGNLPNFARLWPGRVRRLLHSAQVVVAPSRYLQEVMLPYRDDILLIPNAVAIGNYPYHPRETPRPRLVWLRAFHETYDPPLAVRVAARLREAFPELHLTMIGPDQQDGSLERTRAVLDELGVSECVKLILGVPKSEVPARLNEGDILLNTPVVDNTPVGVLEAMACGLCVVSTNVGGIPYLLDNERHALLVPAHDPEAMAGAVTRILTEPGLARRLSRNGRALTESFDWSTILPRWEAVFSSLGGS